MKENKNKVALQTAALLQKHMAAVWAARLQNTINGELAWSAHPGGITKCTY